MPPTCDWVEDEDGVWESACDEAWISTTDSSKPSEHRYRYCPWCGKEIREHPQVWEPEGE